MNFIKVSCLIAQTKRCRSRAVKWRQRNIQKSVMHVLSYCFANLYFFAVLVAVASVVAEAPS